MATPYSSPDLYFRLQPVQTHNWELAGQVLMAKEQKYDANLTQIEQLVQQYVGMDIANIDAKNHLYNNLQNLTSEVDRLGAGADLADRNTMRTISAYIGTALDETTLKAVNTTRMKRQYDATWDEIRAKKPELYSDINRAYGDAGWNNYVNADKDADVGSYVRNGFSVVPYVDVQGEANKNFMEFMKIAKDRQYSQPIQVLNPQTGQMETVGFNKFVESGIDPVVVRGIMGSTLSPRVTQQMAINAWAKYGQYNEQGVNKLKQDFSEYYDQNINNMESTLANLELKGSQYAKGSTEERELKQSLSRYRTEIGALKDRKTTTLSEIDNGNYSNAGTSLESARYIDQGVGIFGSFYSKNFVGTDSNDIYWKQKDFEQKERFHNDDLLMSQSKLDFEREKAKKEEEDLISSGMSFLPTTVEESGTQLSPEAQNKKEVVDLQNNRFSVLSGWVKDIDDVLYRNEAGDLTDTAFALREKYAQVLGLKDKKYKTMSLENMMATYDKYGSQLSDVLTSSSVGVNSPLSTINTGNAYNRASQLMDASSQYKSAFSAVNKIEKDKQNATFTTDSIKDYLSNSDNLVIYNSRGKMTVGSAKDVFGQYLNEDGSFKSNTTPQQRESITDRIKQTRNIQTRRVQEMSPSNQEFKEWTSLSNNDRYLLSREPVYRANRALGSTQESANQQASQRHKELFDKKSTIKNDAVISSKLSNGKQNPTYSEVANMFNYKNGERLDFTDGNTVSATPNADGSFTFKANKIHTVKGEDISTPTTITLNAEEVARTLPNFYRQAVLDRVSKAPLNTYENIGTTKTINRNIGFFNDTEINHSLSLTDGNLQKADMLTTNGALNYIINNDQMAYQGLSNVFENFNQNIKSKISDMSGKYEISASFSPDRNSTQISLETKDGKHIFSIQRPLDSDGSIDSSVKEISKTPQIAISQIISELIRVNYYQTNGDFDSSAWKLLMGDMKRK